MLEQDLVLKWSEVLFFSLFFNEGERGGHTIQILASKYAFLKKKSLDNKIWGR